MRLPAHFGHSRVWFRRTTRRDAAFVLFDHPQRHRTRPAGEAGQASLEYAGVLAVVAAVLVLGGALAGGGAIVNGVVRGVELALCRVGGGDCLAQELEACSVRSRETGGRVGVKATVVEVAGRFAILREQLSDGSFDVSVLDDLEAAASAGVGAEAGVQLGGKRTVVGASASVERQLRLGRRRLWHRPDGAAADRLVRALLEDAAVGAAGGSVPLVGGQVRKLARRVGLGDQSVPPPDVEAIAAGVSGAVEAGLSFGPKAEAGFSASVGGSRDRRSGRRTVLLALTGDVAGTLGGALEEEGFGRRADVGVTLTFDRAGRPLELATVTRDPDPGVLGLDLPSGARQGTDAELEVTARLDLQRQANRAVAERVLRALSPRGRGELRTAAGALAAQLRGEARLDVTRRREDVSTYGIDVDAGVVGRLGGGASLTRTETSLDGAWTRPAGGAWEARTDCLPGMAAAT